MKKICILLLLCLGLSQAYSFDGVFTGEKKLELVKSKWFDIIYQPSSEDSARILFEKADTVYEEIAGEYGISPQFRMPVVLTSAVEDFNAYWTSFPYNHIVLYDTGVIEDLNVFTETLLSTFRHELTHAVTYNLRCPFLQDLDNIFGDPLNPAPLIITSGWAEGATLTYESKNGQGRLNDEYAMQMVKQAKIEGVFPHYSDIQGASDLYPIGAFYYFNGAFAQYLQDTYGMEKYARFWYLCVNLAGISAKGIFKRVYGLKLYDAWTAFVDSYELPPLQAVNQKDLCNNEAGALYSSLTKSPRGLAFLEKKSSSVYFIDQKQLSSFSEGIKAKKIFYRPNIEAVRFSEDGSFLIATIVKENEACSKKSISIYSLDNKKWFDMEENGLQDGCILQMDGAYYLICQGFISQHNSIKFFKLNIENNTIKAAEEIKKIDFEVDVNPYSFTALGKGVFAFIKKDGLSYSICLSDLEGNILKEYIAPKKRMTIRYLSFDGENLLFSWTEPKSLPRFGKLFLDREKGFEEARFELQTFDFSGGLYWPVGDCQEKELFYVGSFFRRNKLFSGQIELSEELEAEAKNKSIEEASSDELALKKEFVKNEAFLPQKYKPFDYYSQGFLIPVSQATSRSYNPQAESSYSLPIGLTYISCNPWSEGVLAISAGYGRGTNSAGLDISYSSGSDTSIFSYSTSASVEFDRHFWKQASASLSLSSSFPLGNISYLSISNKAFAHYGRSNKVSASNTLFPFCDYESDDLANYFYAKDTVTLSYSNVHKMGPGRYEKGGIKFSILGAYILNAKGLPFSETYQNGGQLGFNSIVYIPRLLPIDNLFRYSYNLPTKLSLYLFSSQNKSASLALGFLSFDISAASLNVIPNYNLAKLQTETILFGYDIQKAVPGMRFLFANDFFLSFSYTGGFTIPDDLFGQNWRIIHISDYLDRIKSNNMEYSYYLSLKATIGLTPNFGGMANYSNKMIVYSQLAWLSSNKFVFDFGLDVSF